MIYGEKERKIFKRVASGVHDEIKFIWIKWSIFSRDFYETFTQIFNYKRSLLMLGFFRVSLKLLDLILVVINSITQVSVWQQNKFKLKAFPWMLAANQKTCRNKHNKRMHACRPASQPSLNEIIETFSLRHKNQRHQT